jgi:hypothetical protein
MSARQGSKLEESFLLFCLSALIVLYQEVIVNSYKDRSD